MRNDFFNNVFDTFFDEFEKVFRDNPIFYQTPDKKANGDTYVQPNYDIQRSDDELNLTIEIPGVSKEDVAIEFHDFVKGKQLTLVAQRNGSKPLKYKLTVNVPMNCDDKNCEAKLENGILTVLLKRFNHVKNVKQIKVT